MKHPKHLSKKTNLHSRYCCRYRCWITRFSSSILNFALTRTFSFPINHHMGNYKQSLSCENNRREKVNKVSSGAVRKPNNEVWRNSLKSWRRPTARLGPAGVKGDAWCVCVYMCDTRTHRVWACMLVWITTKKKIHSNQNLQGKHR